MSPQAAPTSLPASVSPSVRRRPHRPPPWTVVASGHRRQLPKEETPLLWEAGQHRLNFVFMAETDPVPTQKVTRGLRQLASASPRGGWKITFIFRQSHKLHPPASRREACAALGAAGPFPQWGAGVPALSHWPLHRAHAARAVGTCPGLQPPPQPVLLCPQASPSCVHCT